MFYITVGTANSIGTCIYYEDHRSVIDGRMPARAGFRALLRTERDLGRG
jgi:hypothetical protein